MTCYCCGQVIETTTCLRCAGQSSFCQCGAKTSCACGRKEQHRAGCPALEGERTYVSRHWFKPGTHGMSISQEIDPKTVEDAVRTLGGIVTTAEEISEKVFKELDR